MKIQRIKLVRTVTKTIFAWLRNRVSAQTYFYFSKFSLYLFIDRKTKLATEESESGPGLTFTNSV